MATHFRAQVCWQVGSMLPRDAQCINPCFKHGFDPGSILGPDWQQLADDLATGVSNWASGGTTRQITVKLYEIKDPVEGEPNRPKATKVLNTNNSAATSYPGEIAVCLSFYGGSGGPHQRGRLYLPYFTLASGGVTTNRPDPSLRTNAGGLAPVLANLGGANVDWVVWSPTRKESTKVSNWFVDDEYDTQRRRGQKPTARTTGTTSG